MPRIRRVRLGALAAAFALPAALCAAAAPASAVTGPAAAGPAAAGAYAFTARLDFGDGLRSCSAALVGADWIAASAHCFTDDAAGQVTAGKPKWKTTATVGRTDLTGTAGQVRDVVEVVPRQDRDLVLARLASPVTGITPVAFARTAPAAGEELTVAGYGRTKDEWAPLKLHTAAFTVDSTTGTTVTMHGRTAADAICAGDAGGPIVRQKDGRTELVALGSQSYQGGCFGTDAAQTSTDAVSTRMDNVAGGNTLTAGTVLNAGDSLTSNAARLTLQPDGNLVVVSNAGSTVWSTRTAGHPGATARFDANGNLAVVDTDGATVLWQSRTTAPGGKAVLQDRGNFVVYNAKGEAQWGAGTNPRHDYTGDGRSDIAVWYDYADGHQTVIGFTPSGTDGKLGNRSELWTVAPGNYYRAHMQLVTGDYNGDGRDDLATFYGYDDGSVKTITWTAKADGTLNPPAHSWGAATGNWTFDRIRVIERYNSPS